MATTLTPIPGDVDHAVGELIQACEPHLHNDRVAGLSAVLSELRDQWADERGDAADQGESGEQQKSEAGSRRLAGALLRLHKSQAAVRPEPDDLIGRGQQADESRDAQLEYLRQVSPAGARAHEAARAA